MSDSNQKFKIIAVVITALLFASLFVTFRYVTLNNESANELNGEKLKSESLLSEKLQLQKEIERLKKEILTLSGNNSDLDRQLAMTGESLRKAEGELGQIKRSNASVRNLQKEVADLKDAKSKLELQLAALNEEVTRLKLANENLKQENLEANGKIAQLQSEKDGLEENVRLLSAMADGTLLQTMKKNEKLTVKSRQTKKISFAFDVPQRSLGEIEFKVVSPQSKVYTKNDGSVSYHLVEGDGNPVAALGLYPGQFELVQRVEMIFSPKEKLTGGIYNIEVYNRGTRLGLVSVKLK